jgi:class 3 adenylate cyclase
MPEDRVERRLAAILSADVVGYSRLMGEDEAGTLAALKALRKELFGPTVAEHHGRIVKLMGDGALVEFPSVVDAVECAVAVQQGMAARNVDTIEGRCIALRIGVNLGDIVIEGNDIYGDGVNVAARLQEMAEPESVCISGAVFGQIESKVDHVFADLGAHLFKNISKPVRAYLYRVHPSDTSSTVEPRPFIDMSSKTTISITGGCLCGEVRYQISEPAIKTLYCHCRMCQRFSGAQMYAGTSFPSGAIRFTQGEPKYYRSSPLGERGFCANCGSSLTFRPSLPQWSDWMEICTASLDNPEDFPPTYHLGVESQMPWLNVHDDLPRIRCDEAPALVEAWASVSQDKE